MLDIFTSTLLCCQDVTCVRFYSDSVGRPALMGSTRSGIRSEFYSSVLAAASFLKAFGIQTNGKWSLWYPILSKSVLNNMSL